MKRGAAQKATVTERGGAITGGRYRYRKRAGVMAGLGLFGQKSVIAETMPIVTAFKFCIGHRKKWAPGSLTDRSSFLVFL
jgi:hypothetical protein